jgi:putrescine aminotransferase
MKEWLKEFFLAIYRMYEQYINPGLAKLIKSAGFPVEISARGSWITDHLGRKWLDMCSCYGVLSLGHLHPTVVAAVIIQLGKMAMPSKVCLSKPQAQLAKRLGDLSLDELPYTFFSNSGTEAVDAALKIAILATGRIKFVSTENSFHGKGLGPLSVSGRPEYQDPFRPVLNPNVTLVPFNECAALKAAIDDDTAAFIVETVQGEGGIHVATLEFLATAQRCCHEHGAKLIIDEVQTGLGRTGKMYGVDHYPGIIPNIRTLAKALGGGVMPIGATSTDYETYHRAYDNRSSTLHTSTFGGNPLACAAGLATLKVLERENLPEQARISGEYLLASLRQLAKSCPDLIAEVRGLGLLIGIEFHKEDFAGKVMDGMKRRRVIAVYTMNQPRVIRLEPPLNISREDIDFALEAFKASVEEAEQLRLKLLAQA